MTATKIDFAAERTRNTFVVDVGDLVINEAENGRRQTRISDEFVQSMMTGQVQACRVRRVGSKWKLVSGFRRAKAVAHINEHKLLPERMLLRVEVAETLNDETAFLENLKENKDREDVTALDNATNINRLKELYNWTDKRIAEFYGRTDAWVSKTRKLLSLDAKFQKLIDERVITASQAEKLVDCDEDFRNKLYEQIKADGFCKFSAGDIVRQAREEDATDTKKNAQLKPKEIRAFFEGLAEPDEAEGVPAYVTEFAKVALKWVNGHARMGNTKFYTELVERLKTRVS